VGDRRQPRRPAARGRNFFDLTPGDGEQIMAAVTWRELVFIFKETKFFVLWGEGTGADGTPTFQVREVVNAIGLVSPLAVASAVTASTSSTGAACTAPAAATRSCSQTSSSPLWTQDPDVYFRSAPINLERLDLVRAMWMMERLLSRRPDRRFHPQRPDAGLRRPAQLVDAA
jgi:hypothetical protein